MSRSWDIIRQQSGIWQMSKMRFLRCSGYLKVMTKVHTGVFKPWEHMNITQISLPIHWLTLASCWHNFSHHFQTHALFDHFVRCAKWPFFRCSWAVLVILETILGMFRHSKRVSDLKRVFLRNFEIFRIFRQNFWRPSKLDAWRNVPENRKKSCFAGLWKLRYKCTRDLKQVLNSSPHCRRLFSAIKLDQIIVCHHPKVSQTPPLGGFWPFSRFQNRDIRGRQSLWNIFAAGRKGLKLLPVAQ